MARTAAEIAAAVAAAGLLSPGRPVLVMFSGGRDSTCLLDLAVRLVGAGHVRALHVNYGLREGTALEERHVEAICENLDVALSVHRPPAPGERGNLQAWAREARYGAAAQLAGDVDIAAGHTATDQLETVLYRLISSPSRRALLGMEPRRGALVRPLLTITREETGAYCEERGLAYLDDPSNRSSAYVRNRIRHELVPLLARLHPGADANVLALVEVLREEHVALEAQVADIVADGRVGLDRLGTLPRALARLAIQRLADLAIDGPAAGVGRRVDEVIAMGRDARLDLPGGVRAVSEGGLLHFERTPPLLR